MIPKFLKKVVLIGLIWASLVYAICLLLPFHYFNGEYPMWLSKMEKMKQHDHYGNFILGDSRAIAGLDPKVLGSDYYNLALGGGTPMEGYFMLKKMLEENKKIDTLIVSYAPLHLEQSEVFWDRQLKYNFYNTADIDIIFNELNIDNEFFWSYDESNFFKDKEKTALIRKAYGNYFRNPMALRPELSKSFLLRGYSNYKIYREIKDRKGSYDFGTKSVSHELNVEARRPNFKPKKVLISCLEKTFELAEENDIAIVYISLPMNEASHQALTENYSEGVLRLYKDLEERHPKVRFQDPGLTAYEDSYFGDASHLNSKGRLKFSTEIRNHLSSISAHNNETLLTSN